MFEKLLLNDAYNYTFGAILLKYGFLEVPKILEGLGVDYLIEGGIRRVGKKEFSNMMLNIYQMSILYDEFVLIEEYSGFNFFDLSKNDFMPTKVIKNDEDISFVNQEKQYFMEYIEPILKSNLKEFNQFIKRYFSGTNVDFNRVENEILRDILDRKLEKLYKTYIGVEWVEWSNEIFRMVKDIQNLHEISALNDCPLLSKEYDFRKTHAECNDIENYALIRIQYKNIIGELPIVNNAYEILKIKKCKKREIRFFRQVFEEFETIIKTDGKEKAINKISKDMRKVSIELAKGNIVDKVANWASVLLVPVTVAQTLLELPPVGLGVDIIAWISARYISKNNSYKKWIEIIR